MAEEICFLPGVVALASKYRNNEPCVPINIFGGSFNFCVQVRFDGGTEWVLRFPIPGRVMHPEEKVRQEVATMMFIREKTNIPIPGVIAFGMAKDNPMELGPFIITEFVRGRPLSELLQRNPPDASGKILNPDIDDSTLEIIYKQIAHILLELSDHDFEKIGSLALVQREATSWSVDSRPLTLKMNEMERCGNLSLDGQ
jgi:aminoglycoside phosphotransferase (APT) family kinase protein